MKKINTKRQIGDNDFKFEWFWQWFINQETPYISVKDRLPQDDQEVELIVIFENIDQLPINIKRKWHPDIFKEEDKEISHWRAL